MRIMPLNTWGGRSFYPLLTFFKKEHENADIFCLQEIYDAEQGGIDERHPDSHVRVTPSRTEARISRGFARASKGADAMYSAIVFCFFVFAFMAAFFPLYKYTKSRHFFIKRRFDADRRTSQCTALTFQGSSKTARGATNEALLLPGR